MNSIKELWAVNYTLSLAGILCLLSLFAAAAFAQSTSVEYPTPVSTNELAGRILARDLGDARLTSYYYTFNGSQGDIFVNVATANFNGDIDIFVADGLRPLSKISFYADSSVTETGRVIYLRKPERLILRVQGRTPDDNPATFRIKFAGSFVAIEGGNQPEEPKLPEVDTADAGAVRVNSVGTIIQPEPKPKPPAKTSVAKNEESEENRSSEEPAKVIITDNAETAKTEESEAKTEEAKSGNDTEKKPAPPPKRTTRNSRNRAATRTPPAASRTRNKPAPKKADPIAVAEAKPNPLENVRMIVLMKDGERLEFPMTDVFRFSMTNGMLSITTKDGKIIRKPLLDIQEFSIK